MVRTARRARPAARGSILRAALLSALVAIPLQAQRGKAAFDEGMRLMRANDPAKAETQFEHAVAADDRNALYHLWLGNAVGQQASNASALRQPFMARRIKAEFERAVALDPDLLEAREGLISYYMQAPGFMGGSADKAREQQREIARRNAYRGHLAASNIAAIAKDTAGVEPALRAAITGQQLPRGEQLLRALIAAPEWTVENSRPTRAVVHYRLGTLLEKAGRRPDAKAAYERAIALDPQLKPAKDALAALR